MGRSSKPTVVRAGETRIPDGPATPGMHRLEAFSGEGVWVGTVKVEPGTLTGWHHHGEYDTYIYVLSGTARIDHIDGTQTVSEGSSRGDVIFVPRGTVHREGSASADGAEAVLFRVGHGELVFNVDEADLPPSAR